MRSRAYSVSAACPCEAVAHVSSVPQSLHYHRAFRVLVEAAHPDIVDTVTMHGVHKNGRWCMNRCKRAR